MISGAQEIESESKAYRSHSYHKEAFLLRGHSSGILRKGAVPRERVTAQNIGYKKKNRSGAHTSEVSTSSSLADSVIAVRLAAFFLPVKVNVWGKNQQRSRSDYQTNRRVFSALDGRPLRRQGAFSSGSSFTSDSSGGSERGLDVAVRGLSGGLTLPSRSGLEALPPAHVRFCVFVWVRSCESPRCAVAREASGEARTCSHQCSYGRITRV